jgi:hypothetical protein
MWLEQLILKQAEKRLQSPRVQGESLKKSLETEYQKCFPRIKNCYEQAAYWHGTGRYHYAHSGESRYESGNAEGTLDVLDSIIKNDGLMPHADPWIASGGKTVSLGTVRMHSRLFARIHLYEGDTLLYELGSARYWTRLYMLLLLFWLLTNMRSCRQFMKSLLRRSSSKDFQLWAGALRKPHNGKVVRIAEVMNGEALGSDIKGNYPILIGIAKGTLKVMETIPLVHAVEVRSFEKVTMNNFTHLEVPLKNVKETGEFLRSRGVTLEVLPMEFVDIYMSTLSVKELAWL